MDDYNTSVLSEAKNEYSANLVNILTPLLIQGLQSIFKEACSLCKDNDEYDKYLMTFQNFLTRVPKWNQELIDNETKRIIQQSKCNYLEDLLTCVHITQLKVLTSIRVATKQKKIDIDIPKISDFIHKVYIKCARKCYSNVYLFETDIEPLTQQKNFRECETICKECILNTVRESMPVEKILRAYMDETTEEEIVEEEIVEPVKVTDASNNLQESISAEVKEEIKKAADAIKTGVDNTKSTVDTKSDTAKVSEEKKDGQLKLEIEETIKDLENKLQTEKEEIKAPVQITTEVAPVVKTSTITFNDTDSVVNYNKNLSSTNNPPAEDIAAPKTIDRLEKISQIRNDQRKLDEEEEDDDGDRLTIFSDAPSLKLDALDVQVLDNNLSLKKPPVLTGIETL
ncbi:MAG: hypothetical protein CXT73_05840 [Methanobacteriota archaeon]|nr:MAG: hypothetical protein CXT73_05840 [Euryarchaeota archaeon]